MLDSRFDCRSMDAYDPKKKPPLFKSWLIRFHVLLRKGMYISISKYSCMKDVERRNLMGNYLSTRAHPGYRLIRQYKS
jgi:hypothetical protein